MLVVVIFGIVAALSFKRTLTEKGYTESRAWAFPIFSGSVIFCFAYLLNFVSRFWVQNPDSPMIRFYPIIVGLLALSIHAILVRKIWVQIKSLPDRDSSDPPGD